MAWWHFLKSANLSRCLTAAAAAANKEEGSSWSITQDSSLLLVKKAALAFKDLSRLAMLLVMKSLEQTKKEFCYCIFTLTFSMPKNEAKFLFRHNGNWRTVLKDIHSSFIHLRTFTQSQHATELLVMMTMPGFIAHDQTLNWKCSSLQPDQNHIVHEDVRNLVTTVCADN